MAPEGETVCTTKRVSHLRITALTTAAKPRLEQVIRKCGACQCPLPLSCAICLHASRLGVAPNPLACKGSVWSSLEPLWELDGTGSPQERGR